MKLIELIINLIISFYFIYLSINYMIWIIIDIND